MSYSIRPYQKGAVEGAFEQWRNANSTLIVLPTGTGKTVTFAEIIRRIHPKRTMMIAHREELIYQAKEKIEKFGITCDIEMADLTAATTFWGQADCVLASVQTLVKRLHRFDPTTFGLLVVDEAHHVTAETYRRIVQHFKQNPALKILGVTATPDRTDEEALGQIFDTVAYDYEIVDAINDGWLVEPFQERIEVASLDYSNVRTTAGDLNGADLARLMELEENLQGICGSAIEIIGDQRTIFFAASVPHAEKACEIFNRHKAGMAAFVCGETDKETRRQIMERARSGDLQVLTNVGVATEGTDLPLVSAIVMARPTKSRSLYAQMAGRGLRPLPGIVDPFPEAEARRLAIAESAKPNCLLIDYVGNSGKHKLMTAMDILGGKVSDEVMDRAERLMESKTGRMSPMEMIQQAEADLQREKEERERRRMAEEARRAKLVAKVEYNRREVNPFDILDITPARERAWDRSRPLSEKQQNLLLRQGIDPSKLTYTRAQQIIGELFKRWDKKQCSLKQAQLLKRYGYRTDMSQQDAKVLIDRIAANRWQRPDPIDVNP